MINLVADNWHDAWRKTNAIYADSPETATDKRISTRAFSFYNTITVQNNDLDGLNETIVGYQSYKLKLFEKRYIIPGLKDKVGGKLLERLNEGAKFTNLSYNFNFDVPAHDQGGCLVNILITAVATTGGKYRVEYDIYIRTAEVTKRLLVDFLKFQEHIRDWNELIVHRIDSYGIKVHARALYAQPLFLVIFDTLYPDVRFDGDHWLHVALRKQYDKMFSDDYKLKMGKRVRKHVTKIREGL